MWENVHHLLLFLVHGSGGQFFWDITHTGSLCFPPQITPQPLKTCFSPHASFETVFVTNTNELPGTHTGHFSVLWSLFLCQFSKTTSSSTESAHWLSLLIFWLFLCHQVFRFFNDRNLGSKGRPPLSKHGSEQISFKFMLSISPKWWPKFVSLNHIFFSKTPDYFISFFQPTWTHHLLIFKVVPITWERPYPIYSHINFFLYIYTCSSDHC